VPYGKGPLWLVNNVRKEPLVVEDQNTEKGRESGGGGSVGVRK